MNGRVKGLVVALAVTSLAGGCGENPPTPIPDTEVRPDGHGQVVKVEPGAEVGDRLTLDNGAIVEIGPPGTRMITNEESVDRTLGQSSLVIYGHDARGTWVLWLGLESRIGPDCFGLRRLGYDRHGFIALPSDGVALPKAGDFHLESGAFLGRDPRSQTFGWYTAGGGEVPASPLFCFSRDAEATSAWP